MTVSSPTVLSIDARSNRISWQAVPVESIFSTGKSVEYAVLDGRDEASSGDAVRNEPSRTRNTLLKVLRRARQSVETMKEYGVMPASAEVGQSVLLNMRSGARFAEITWARRDLRTVRHWIRVKALSNPVRRQPSEVAFVTGTCLFGRSDAVALLADGRRHPLVSSGAPLPSSISRLEVRQGLSPYELDTACRLSTVIGTLAGRPSSKTSIYVHVPVPEYVLSLFGRHSWPFDPSVMEQWIAAVHERGAKVADLFRERLLAERPGLKTTIGSPLEMLLPYLHKVVKSGRRPQVPEMLRLIRDSDPAMRECLEWWLRDRGDLSIEVDELAHFGYCAGVLHQATGPRDKLTVEVDNPSEERIFRTVNRIAKRARKHGSTLWGSEMIALYPHEQTVEASEGVLDFEASAEGFDIRPSGKNLSGNSARLMNDLLCQYGCQGA